MAIKTLLPGATYIADEGRFIEEIYIDGVAATITGKTVGSNGTEVVDLATDGIYTGSEAKAVVVPGPIVFGPFKAVVNATGSASNIRLNIV